MDRQRITITLKKSVIQGVDNTIDGTRIRNRSHAIEYLLSKSLKPKVTQAVILAGGQGVKMRPLTYEIPKALIPVDGKPVLEYLIEFLRDTGIREIILAVGYLEDKIMEYFGSGSKYGVKITYSREQENLGTAGALANSYRFLKDKPFLVLHGDILIDLDFNELIEFHSGLGKTIGTIVLSTVSNPSEYGNVTLKGSKIMAFTEKPSKKETTSYLVSTGVYIFQQQIFDYIGESIPAMLEDIFPILAKEGKLGGFAFAGKWSDVSTPENYKRAIEEWRRKT